MITKLVSSVRSYVRVRDAQNALSELSDAALKDIGLTRAEIAFLSARPEPVQPMSATARDSLLASLIYQPTAQAA